LNNHSICWGHDMIKRAFVETEQKTQVINITAQLADMVAGMPDGLALFYTLHTTVTLLISEDDPELRDDLIRAATNLLASCRAFKHVRSNNPNAEAHIISALGGTCLTVAVVGGKPDLGTYQNILLLEMDGPKRREIRCCIVA
jgi:secondary thiamine-phosphate synthase enzyme